MEGEELTAEDIKRAMGEEAEEVEEVEEEREEEVIPRPRRGRPPRRRPSFEIPKELEEPLKKISGADALKIMHLLHTAYLSWITEAEAEKYYITVSRAYSEALQQQQQTLRELTSAFAQQLQNTITPALESLSKSLEAISTRVAELEKSTRPSMIDDRLILLGSVLLKGFRDKLGLPKEIDSVLDYVIYESARGFLSKRGVRVEEEKEEKTGEEKGREK